MLALGFSAFFCSASRDQAPNIIFGPCFPVSGTPSRPHFRVVTFGAQPPTTCWLFGCFNTFDFHSSLCFLVRGPIVAAIEFVQIRVAKRRVRPQKRQGAKKRQGAAPKQAGRLAPPLLSLPSPKVAGHDSPKRIRALRPLQKKGGHAPSRQEAGHAGHWPTILAKRQRRHQKIMVAEMREARKASADERPSLAFHLTIVTCENVYARSLFSKKKKIVNESVPQHGRTRRRPISSSANSGGIRGGCPTMWGTMGWGPLPEKVGGHREGPRRVGAEGVDEGLGVEGWGSRVGGRKVGGRWPGGPIGRSREGRSRTHK